ncbi:hypothetical protein M1D88_15880 [Arthrobacter sp. R1-13]
MTHTNAGTIGWDRQGDGQHSGHLHTSSRTAVTISLVRIPAVRVPEVGLSPRRHQVLSIGFRA